MLHFHVPTVVMWPASRSIHDVKATDMGADTIRFKAEVNFDGREVARIQVKKLDLETILKVRACACVRGCCAIQN